MMQTSTPAGAIAVKSEFPTAAGVKKPEEMVCLEHACDAASATFAHVTRAVRSVAQETSDALELATEHKETIAEMQKTIAEMQKTIANQQNTIADLQSQFEDSGDDDSDADRAADEAMVKRVLDEVERRAAAKARAAAAAQANGQQQRKRRRTAPLPPPQGGILSALFGQSG